MWTYSQSTGRLYHDGEDIGTGYSGRGAGLDNPAMESVPNVGPLPEGLYQIGVQYTHPHTGPITMRLSPDISNVMFGRGGFLIHGDNSTHTASEGCIVLPRSIREQIAQSTDRRMKVIA